MVEPGLVIAGRYELEQPLGEGAMGAVWRAKHLSLGTTVALKIIRREAALNQDALQRFEREAVLAARIQSAHVVHVLDHGHHEGLPYIVMEYLRGESLRDRLQARLRLTLVETCHIVRHVCRALAQAHEVGLVHRDIKPENLFISPGEEEGEEVVKVLDFGVAKVTDELGLSGIAPTQTGTLLGTPFYVSPEQARGLKLVGPPADMWSLGVVAFECLTGERPFAAAAMGPLMAKIIHGPIPVPSQTCPSAAIPAAVDAWVARALCRDPQRRFASAREMSKALLAAAQIPAEPSALGFAARDDSSETRRWDSGSGQPPPPAYQASSDLAKTAVLPDPAQTVAFPSSPLEAAGPAAPAPTAEEHARMRSNESLIARPWPEPVVIPQKSRAPLWIGVGVVVFAVAGAMAWLLWSGDAPSPVPVTSASAAVPAVASAELASHEPDDTAPEPSEPSAEPALPPSAPPTARSQPPPPWPTARPTGPTPSPTPSPTPPPPPPPPSVTAQPGPPTTL